jgi:hypothetical protein
LRTASNLWLPLGRHYGRFKKYPDMMYLKYV